MICNNLPALENITLALNVIKPRGYTEFCVGYYFISKIAVYCSAR